MNTVQDAIIGATISAHFWSIFGNLDMRIEPFSADVLRELRKEFKIDSQRELALRSGLPESTIKKLEAGTTKQPSHETLLVLGKFFNLFFYVDWTAEKTPPKKDGDSK